MVSTTYAVDPPVILTIAGSDSSGGAGIQADLKTFTALQCYGASVVTALTAQNTTGVQGVHAPPAEFVEQQLRSVLEDLNVCAFKTGMLYDAATTRVVATTLREHSEAEKRRLTNTGPDSDLAGLALVCDPVCVSTSGHPLLQPEALEILVDQLLPLSTVVTPNKAEAELLLDLIADRQLKSGISKDARLEGKIESLDLAVKAAVDLCEYGGCAVLLKGGHVATTVDAVESVVASAKLAGQGVGILQVEWNGVRRENQEILIAALAGTIGDSRSTIDIVVDVLVESAPRTTTLHLRKRLPMASTHGTGCTLSAALACFLGKGCTLREATRLATAFTHQSIAHAFPLGRGHGPLNHLHAIAPRPIPRPNAIEPHPFTRYLIESTQNIWKDYVQHEFVRELGRGTLRRECFVHFIKQDYHYLRYYARAYSLLAAKSSTLSDIHDATKVVLSVLQETDIHASFCNDFGVSEEELESTSEAAATRAYGGYLLETGMRGDTSHLLLTLAACLLGYGEVGLWLIREATRDVSWVVLEGNPYLKWIEVYSGKEYQAAVRTGIQQLEDLAIREVPSPARLVEWRRIWEDCAVLERRFWQMAMDLAD